MKLLSLSFVFSLILALFSIDQTESSKTINENSIGLDSSNPPPVDDDSITTPSPTMAPTTTLHPTNSFGLPKPIFSITPRLSFTIDDTSVYFSALPVPIGRTLSVSMLISCNLLDEPTPQDLLTLGRTKTSEFNSFELLIDEAGHLAYVERDGIGMQSNTIVGSTMVAKGKEVMVALVKNDNVVSLFVDGVLDGQGTTTTTVRLYSPHGISIGGDYRTDAKSYYGSITNLKIYNVALQFTQVPALQITASPTLRPTKVPTVLPTYLPTVTPSFIPSLTPTIKPTTSTPTSIPTILPTSVILASVPSIKPTIAPTRASTGQPSALPTIAVASAVPGVVLSPKPGSDNYGSCDGSYAVKGTLNGKPVYLNAAKSRWIGWNGNMWVVVGTEFYDSILATQAQGFGGFHFSSNGDVPIMSAIWAQYTALYPSVSLEVVSGGSNYASCDGTYVHRGMLNGRPVYVNDARNRWIGWNGISWALTGMQWYDEFLTNQAVGFGAFHFSLNGNVPIYDSSWNSYSVRVLL